MPARSHLHPAQVKVTFTYELQAHIAQSSDGSYPERSPSSNRIYSPSPTPLGKKRQKLTMTPVRRALQRMLIGIATVTLGVSLCEAQPSAQSQPNDSNAIETVCRLCHRDKFEALESNPHRVLDAPEWRERTSATPGCISCHGDVSPHISSGGGRGSVFAFRDEPPSAQAEICLNCHSEDHPGYQGSSHAQAGVSCTSCHSQHGQSRAARNLLKMPPADALGLSTLTSASSSLCADCHHDALTAFSYNERHPLREGVMECVSCHDPHAGSSRSLLGGFKQQECIDCHQDKGGPFVFEHAASRVEGCTACHEPHGSPNRHLLVLQRTGELCFSCHATVPQFHLGFNPSAPPRFGLDTQCTNCHSSIHGSNLDAHFLR